MMSVGHGGMGPPTSLVGGAALGNVKVPTSQHKLDALADKLKNKKKTQKSEDEKKEPMPTNEKNPLDWDSVIGDKINRFSQLLRSEIVKIKLEKLKDKLGK
jgi:hypothetical protein